MEAFGPLTFALVTERTGNELSKQECVQCLFCSDVFAYPRDKTNFTTHLLIKHNFVIQNIEDITNMRRYCEYWRKRLEYVSADSVCESSGPVLTLGPSNSEDKGIRNKLQHQRLIWVLEQHVKERMDNSFERACLFCRIVVHGTRAEYLSHLQDMHNMYLGKPDNLIFIDKLIDKVEERLNKLQCLYCKGLFKDRAVLKEHMRKKQHKTINPSDLEFDQFYIINYTDMRKSPKYKVESEEQDGEEEEDGTWSDWVEDEESVVCLFCSTLLPFDDIVVHMKDTHDFNFNEVYSFNFYEQVKLVNYIRRQVHLGCCPVCNEKTPALLHHMASARHFILPDKQLWDQPEYYFPTFENDSLLCRLDDLQDETQTCEEEFSHTV